MDMKKTVALLTVMLMLTVFFSVPVFAIVPTAQRRATDHFTSGNLVVTTTATLLYSTTYESAGMSNGYLGGAVTETVLTLRLYNSSATLDTRLDSCVISVQYDSYNVAPFLCGWDNYTTDLYISDGASTQLLTVVPSADYSSYTGIVIPPHQSLYLVASIYTQAKNDTAATTPDSVYLSSVSTSVTGVSSGSFDYPGDPTPADLSAIADALENIDDNTDNIESLLLDIKTQLQWTGSYASPSVNTAQSIIRSDVTDGLDYMYTSYTIYSGNSFIATQDVEFVDNSHYYDNYERVVPILIQIQYENYYDYAVANTATHTVTFSDLLPKSSNISYIIAEYSSNTFNIPRINYNGSNPNYVDLLFDYSVGTMPTGGGAFQGVVARGMNYSTFLIYAYIKDNQNSNNTLVLNSSFTNPATTFRITDMNMDADGRVNLGRIDNNLQQFLDNYNAVNGTGDLSAGSNVLTEGLNNAHQTEQGYFEANSQALANSGISNPNFEASDRAGINSAIAGNKNTFGLLWNAIGAWRNVYIYAAMLGLVTYLLRHRPWTSASRAGADRFTRSLSDYNGGDHI